MFYRDTWVSGEGKNRRCLGTCDRAQAERLGKELLAALLRDEQLSRNDALPLAELWERYNTTSPAYLDNTTTTKLNDANHAKVLIGFFGEDCDVRGLAQSDQQAFTAKRRAGGIVCGKDRITEPVRMRSVEVELTLLHAMLRWATTVRIGSGQRLLDRNPLQGVRKPREQDPKRPVATWERFTKTRAAISELESNARSPEEQRKWAKLEMILVLAEATGRRLGSIRQLRWDDWDFTNATVRWRAESDKKGRESIIPVPEALLEEVRAYRRTMGGAFGGLMFPSEGSRDWPLRRDTLDKWLRSAEKAAKLPSLDGGLWHPLRRAWATARKHLSVSDVAQAGGWKDVSTLIRCYQQADNDTMLAVMSEPRKIMDKAVSVR